LLADSITGLTYSTYSQHSTPLILVR